MTAYEMRISDWSSDVCSSDLMIEEEASGHPLADQPPLHVGKADEHGVDLTRLDELGQGLQVESPAHGAAPRVFVRRWNDFGRVNCSYPSVRSEERRVGKECVRRGRSRWSQDH